MVQSKEDTEREALSRLFQSHGWKLFEDRLDELLECEDMKSHILVNGPVKDLSELNFQVGKAKGVLAATLLVEELKEVANPDSEQE